jgi:DNA-binding CsgD family transcriptional regulator
MKLFTIPLGIPLSFQGIRWRGRLIAMDEIFVGREAELAFLLTRLEETLRGMSRTVLLQGAAGVGKTALLEAFLAQVSQHHVLWISGAELEAGLAYGVVDQVVAETGQLPPEWLPEPDTEPAADVEPLRVGRALVEMLGRLQADGQIILVLDDAHWADIPSLKALAFALRRLRSRPVLTLLSVRDDRTNQLSASLHGLLTGPMTARLRLTGLGVEELRELSTALGMGSLSPRAAQRLHEHTGGNPLHVRALLEEIPADVLRHGAGPLPAPRSFALLVLARLAACPPDAEKLVVAASVLGTSCPLALASRLGEVIDPLKALEQAAAAHLLRDHSTAIERLVAFPHPLVRAAVYHDLGPARRAGLHACAARLVGSEPAALRHRVAAASGSDPSLAAEVAALADRQAAVGSWTAAAESLLAAATLAATPSERERSARTAIDYLRLGGNAAEASALASELATLAEGAPKDYGQVRLAGGCQDDELGAPPKLAAAISQQLGVRDLLDARGEAAAAWARQALAAVPHHPPVATQPGDIRPPRRPISSGPPDGCGPIALHQPIGPPQPAYLGAGSPPSSGPDRRIYHGIALAWTDDLPGARNDLTTALTACQRHGSPLPWGLIGLGFLVETEYRLGAWDDAVAHAEFAVSIVHDTGPNWLASFIHAVAAFPLAARGTREAAAAHATEAAAQLQLAGTENCSIWVATAQALLAQAEGDDQRIASVLKPLHLAALPAANEPGWQPWQALYAEALLNLGSRGQAEAVLAPFETLAAARGRPSALAAAARARGTLEAAHGHIERADVAFQAGLQHASDLPLPFERAVLETAYGRYLRRAGRSADAAVHLQAARTRFAQLDARPFLRHCQRELTACHRTSPKRATDPTTSLTPQEQAVARLVANGHTNRATAEALFVSVKTIEYHLSNTYAKLGVTSRTQLALALRQDSGNP